MPELMSQITEDRLKVDYDTYNITVEELCRRFGDRIDVAPEYQRHFVWDGERQSRLIESLLLGIPLPDLFMASSPTKRGWEVVDGVQRLTTIVGFCDPGNKHIDRQTASKLAPELSGLKTLTYLNGKSFSDLDQTTQDFLIDRAVKVIVLNDKSDENVRYELFERLNTGGITLSDQEIRNAVYRGPFTELVAKLAENQDFNSVNIGASFTESDKQERVLRFFAYFDWHAKFEHSVVDFLRDFTSAASDAVEKDPKLLDQLEELFTETMRQLAQHFPNGITRKTSITPVNLYEAISVAAAFAWSAGTTIVRGGEEVTKDEELKMATTGATNSRKQLRNRIERAHFLLTDSELTLPESRTPLVPYSEQ